MRFLSLFTAPSSTTAPPISSSATTRNHTSCLTSPRSDRALPKLLDQLTITDPHHRAATHNSVSIQRVSSQSTFSHCDFSIESFFAISFRNGASPCSLRDPFPSSPPRPSRTAQDPSPRPLLSARIFFLCQHRLSQCNPRTKQLGSGAVSRKNLEHTKFINPILISGIE